MYDPNEYPLLGGAEPYDPNEYPVLEKSYLQQWDESPINQPLSRKITSNNTQIFDPQYAANYYDPPSGRTEDQWKIPDFVPYIGGGTYRSLGAGLLEGAGNVVEGFTTPLNIATLGAFKGEQLAAKYGAAPLAKAALNTGRALSVPIIGSGAAHAKHGYDEGDYGKVGFGVAEMAGGLAGTMQVPHGLRQVAGPVHGPESPTYGPHEASTVYDSNGQGQLPGFDSPYVPKDYSAVQQRLPFETEPPPPEPTQQNLKFGAYRDVNNRFSAEPPPWEYRPFGIDELRQGELNLRGDVPPSGPSGGTEQPIITPPPTEEMPKVVTLRSPDMATVEYYRNKGYKSIPGMRSPEGYAQMVRGDIAGLYPEVPPTEAPSAIDPKGAFRGGKESGNFDVKEVPNDQVTKKFISNMAKGGFGIVSKDEVKTTFKKFVKSEDGSFSWDDLKEGFRKLRQRLSDTPEEPMDARAQLRAEGDAQMKAEIEAWRNKGRNLNDDYTLQDWFNEEREIFTRHVERMSNEIESESIRGNFKINQLQRFMEEDKGEFDWEAMKQGWQRLRDKLGREPNADEMQEEANRIRGIHAPRPGEQTGLVADFSRGFEPEESQGIYDTPTDPAKLQQFLTEMRSRTGEPPSREDAFNKANQGEGQIPWEGTPGFPDEPSPHGEFPPLSEQDLIEGGGAFDRRGEPPNRPPIPDFFPPVSGLHPRMAGRIEQAGVTGPWDLTPRAPVEQGNLFPMEMHQRNQLENIANTRAEQLKGENWGETTEPTQESMIPQLLDSEITDYLKREDATPPEMRDLSTFEGYDKYLKDEGTRMQAEQEAAQRAKAEEDARMQEEAASKADAFIKKLTEEADEARAQGYEIVPANQRIDYSKGEPVRRLSDGSTVIEPFDKLVDYTLPDGRVVPIRLDVARGAEVVQFGTKNGIVDAVRSDKFVPGGKKGMDPIVTEAEKIIEKINQAFQNTRPEDVSTRVDALQEFLGLIRRIQDPNTARSILSRLEDFKGSQESMGRDPNKIIYTTGKMIEMAKKEFGGLLAEVNPENLVKDFHKIENPKIQELAKSINLMDRLAEKGHLSDETYNAIIPREAGRENFLRPLGEGETWRGRALEALKTFFDEEAGSASHRATWQGVKEATGWGQGITEVPKKVKGKASPKETSFITEALAMPAAATTTLDASALLRQGLLMIHTPEFWRAAGKMFEGGLSRESFNRIDADLRSKDIFQKQFNPRTGKFGKSYADQIGMKLFKLPSEVGPHAEATASRWLETGGSIPYASATYRNTLGVGVRASNRMFTTFLNHLNANRTEFLLNKVRDMSLEALNTGEARQGIAPWKTKFSPEEAMNLDPYQNLRVGREIADFVNTATGHGPLRTPILPFKQVPELNLEKYSSGLSKLLFSPQLLFSRIRMLNPSTYVMASPFVRKEYMKSALGAASAWFAFTQMAKLAGGDDASVNNDITSADFGKVRIGNTRLDFGGGFLQFAVAAGRMYEGGATSSSTGKFHRFGSGYQAQTQEDMMERFFVNKLNPVTKFAYDLYNASEYNKFHVFDRTAQMFISLSTQDIVELAKEDPELLPWMIPVLFGGGTQTYSKGESVSKLVPKDYDWNVSGGGIRDLMPWNWNERSRGLGGK